MATLTVFIAPDGPAGGVLDVLTDLSAAGLVDPFLWVTTSSADAMGIGADVVERGRRRPVTVEDAVADRHHDRVRLCVVVPLSGPSMPVPMGIEQRLSNVVHAAGIAAPVTQIRCVVARPGDYADSDLLARDGWHNILVAPEDARGPGIGRQQLPPSDDPVEIGRHAAPAIAGIVGLWSGVDHSPLDDDQRPQKGVRAGRSFYRRVDAGAVERDLRTRVLATQPKLPLPRDHTISAVYVEDGAQACRTMAYSLWGKYRELLIGPRATPAVTITEGLNFRNALAWLLRYIWAALKNAPGDWYQGQRNQGATRIARGVHNLVFGSGESAYLVVAGGMTADGLPAGWRDLGTASGRLDDLLVAGGEHEHHARADLSSMWADYVGGALTLADAGLRGAPSMPPAQAEASVGVLRTVTECVSDPEHDFAAIPAHLGSRVHITAVAPGDVLTADLLRRRLEHLSGHAALAQDTGRTLQALTDWMKRNDGSYSVQVGKAIAGSTQDIVAEIQRYLAVLRAASGEEVPDGGGARGLARWIRVLAVLAVLAAVAAPILGVLRVVPVRAAVLVGVIPIVAWVALALVGFAREQREMFRDLHRKQTLLSEVEAARANLRQATRDLRRLTDAYEQYLVWSRIVGVVLREPFGPMPSEAGPDVALAFGLPRTTRIAAALVDEATMGAAATALRFDLFTTGWLSGLWTAHLGGAGAQLGSHELMARPEGLLDLHGGVGGSALQAWAAMLVKAGTAQAPGDEAWAKVMRSLDGAQAAIGTGLLSSVQGAERGDHRPVPLAEFLSGVDEPEVSDDKRGFAGAHFTSVGFAATRARVAVHESMQARIGLSRVAVLVQLSDARPPEEFAVAEAVGVQGELPPPPPPGPADAEPATQASANGAGPITVPAAPEGLV